MTTLLYHIDSYLREMDAIVTRVEGARVALDRTVLYAQGGGQPADHGTLHWDGGQARVVEVRKAGEEVLHTLEGPLPAAGSAVHGVLDWERRYALMRGHTATHVLDGVIWRDFGALVTGSAMEPGSARQDFELEHMSADFAVEVERRTNAELAADREVRVRVLARAEAFAIPDMIRTKINRLPDGIEHVRVIEIVGLDVQADGARTWRGRGRWVRSAWWARKQGPHQQAATPGHRDVKPLMSSRVLAKAT